MNKRDILSLIYEILKQCDPLKEDDNEYVFFDKLMNKQKMKDNVELKNKIEHLLDTLKKGYDLF